MGRTDHFADGARGPQTLPTSRARDYADPVFSPWEKFHKQEAGYISNLASDVHKNGMQNPIHIRDGMILDGHHRLAAAEKLGMSEVPVKYERGESSEPHPPWNEKRKS